MEYEARIVARGEWRPGDIEVVLEELPLLPADVLEKVEAVWKVETTRNPKLTSGPLLVTRRVEMADGGKKLRLFAARSEYKLFMGTTNETVAPGISEEHYHRATGIMAVTTTRDGFVLFGVRSPRIDWGTNRHVVPAGRLCPDEGDPFQGIIKEFGEELGIRPEEIAHLMCVGVVADQTYGRLNYECVFRARVALSAREVLQRALTAKSAGEHCQLEPFLWDGYCFRDLLGVDPGGYVPTGWAGTIVCLWHDFGERVFPEWQPVYRTYAEHMGRRLAMLPPT